MRLRDLETDDPILREASRLLRAADPGEPSAWARHRPPVARAGRHRTIHAPRFALAALLLLVGAFAGATVWRQHEERVERERILLRIPVEVSASHEDGPRTRRGRVEAPQPLAEPDAPPSIAAPEVPAVAATAASPVHARPIAAPSHLVDAPEPGVIGVEPPQVAPTEAPVPAAALSPAVAVEESSDAALLLAATRALKHEHDPATAARSADEHLARFPHSDLVEEAFAISMGAHEQLHDGLAPSVARQYLARFPTGRFHVLAQQIVAR